MKFSRAVVAALVLASLLLSSATVSVPPRAAQDPRQPAPRLPPRQLPARLPARPPPVICVVLMAPAPASGPFNTHPTVL